MAVAGVLLLMLAPLLHVAHGQAGFTLFNAPVSTLAAVPAPVAVAVSSIGSLFVASESNRIYVITAGGNVSVFAGNLTGAAGNTDGQGTSASFKRPLGLAVLSTGAVVVADTLNFVIRVITPSGFVSTLAGSGVRDSVDGQGRAASFLLPRGVAVSSNGTVFVADFLTIRAISPSGFVSSLYAPWGGGNYGIAISSSGTIFLALRDPCLISTISLRGVNSIFAGSTFSCGGSDGQGQSASFLLPQGVAVSSGGTVIVADTGNYMIRSITSSGLVSTLAGSNSLGASDGIGRAASFDTPQGVAISSNGTVFVADFQNNAAIRVIASLLCPTGGYCVDLVSPPVPCPSSTFNAVPGAFSLANCTPCPAGTANFVSGATACVPCSAGYSSSVGAALCQPCPIGSYCPAGLPIPCPSGGFGSAPGAATIAAGCANCSAGFYNPSAGSVSFAACFSCPAGSFSASSGASVCSLCSPGRANPNVASTDPASCIPCARSSFAPLSGQPSCTEQCPAGFAARVGVGAGGTSQDSACSPCTLGAYSPFPGSLSCSSCAPGFYADTLNSTACTPCAQGTSSFTPAATSASQCLACGAGTFGVQPGATSCVPCGVGTWSSTVGATSSAVCKACGPGTFNALSGQGDISACQPCAPGSYSSAPGAVRCSLCPPGTALGTLGASSPDACLPCGAGFSNTASGQALCVAGAALACSNNTQPPSNAPLSSIADCVPLVCAPPLSLAATGSACAGCPPGSAGASPGGCANCAAAGGVCPGFLPAPLFPPATLSASPPSAAAGALAASCTAPSTLAPILDTQSAAFSYFSISPLTAIVVGASLSALALAAWAASQRSAMPLSGCVSSWMSSADSYATAHAVPQGEAVKYVATSLGGACTLVSALTLGTFATVLCIRYAESNVLTQSFIAVLTPTLSDSAAALPWAVAAAPAGSPLAGVTGVQVRVFAQGGLGDCATPIGLTGTGLDGGAWVWTSTPSCGAGDPRSVLTLSCPSCVFTADSALTFSLPWSCQALYLEALSVNALQGVSTLVFPPNSSVATAAVAAAPAGTSGLLSSLAWQLQPVLAVVTDQTRAGVDARGYLLLPGPTTVTRTPPGEVLLPLAAAVRVTVTLPLQATYSQTQLTPLTSPASLLSSIIGLAGILSAFRVLFQCAERVQQRCRRKKAQQLLALSCWRRQTQGGSKRGMASHKAAPAALKTLDKGTPASDAATDNPLRSAPAAVETEHVAVAPADTAMQVDVEARDATAADPGGHAPTMRVQRRDAMGNVWMEVAWEKVPPRRVRSSGIAERRR